MGDRVFIGILERQRHRTQGLVTTKRHISPLPMARALATTDEGLVHQLLGQVVPPLLQQTLDLRQRLQRLGVTVVGGRSRPQRDVVQHDRLCLDTPIGHHAEMTVAQRETFLPDLGRPIIAEDPRLRSSLMTGTERHGDGKEEQQPFHAVVL